MNNVFYFKSIGSVGGCESFFYYLSKIYKDLTIYYREGNPEQIKRLAKNVEVRKYNEEIIECNNFFCCYYPDIIENVKANHYYHIIHCDYKNVWFPPIINPKFEKYIAVSKVAGDSFKELTGLDYELIYNPIKIDIPKVEKNNDGKLHLISATRLTREKGLKRMQQLATLLEKNNIDYEWIVYTNRIRESIGKNVIYKEPKLDILPEIAKADALIQLSSCEAFCYSLVESLMLGTKVVCTNLPVLKEIGVKHGVNGVICDFDMKNVDLDLIKKNMKFTYTPPLSTWDKYLSGDSNYNPKDLVKIRTKRGFTLIDEGIRTIRGQKLDITKERASYLESKGLIERCN